SAAICSACATAASASAYAPPSEKLSGVTLRIPATRGRSSDIAEPSGNRSSIVAAILRSVDLTRRRGGREVSRKDAKAQRKGREEMGVGQWLFHLFLLLC